MTMRDYGSFDCERFAEHLMDHIEGDDDAATRIRMETHAASCDACAALLADVRAISRDAASLPVLAPSRDLWPEIAARIEAPVISLAEHTGEHRRPGRRTPGWLRPAAAAAALVIATAGITWLATRQHSTTPQVAQAPTTAAPSGTTPDSGSPIPTSGQQVATASQPAATATPESPFPTQARAIATPVAEKKKLSPEATYDLEIGRLRQIVKQRRSQMDTTTLHVIEHNLQIIDDAIAQCRAALTKDPNSRFLLDNLNGALDTKIRLLRTAAMLPART